MELSHATPLAARIDIGAPLPSGRRRGMLLAKATFGFDGRLDTQDPHPIYLDDELTPHGLLPRDDMPRLDDAFEVSLLGCAHAPGGAAKHARVSLAIGDLARSIDVFGDRVWLGEGDGAKISEPEPFARMPLTWSRAFGGRAEVEVDVDSPVPVEHRMNAAGKGLDVAAEARKLDDLLTCPPGYPRFERRRPLPNLERPDQRIAQWSDEPEPVAWCPPPIESGVHNARCIRIVEEEGKPPRAVMTDGVSHRASPEWVLPAPPSPGTRVVMEGVTATGREEVRLPGLAVHFDYVLGERTGSRPLKLQALVLLPEERRFYMVYRLPFEVDPPDGSERKGRLRIEEGRSGR